jgi:hypothetical protein
MESEWETCTDPQRMLTFLQGKVSDRKLRLFACACCRKRWKWLTDVRSQKAVVVAEKFADGLAKERDLRNAHAKTAILYQRALNRWHTALREKRECPRSPTVQSHIDRARMARDTAHAALWTASPGAYYFAACQVAATKNNAEKCPWLRHLIGNPFRPPVLPAYLSLAVVQLAGAVYRGHDCGFALHDALLENGQTEIADHFRREKWHPKGCWALDLLLHKE